MKSVIASVFTLLLFTGCSTTRSQTESQGKALVVAACPELTELQDESFGATTLKLFEVTKQYHACRKAALREVK